MKKLYFLLIILTTYIGHGQCLPESSINENFDDWNGDIDECWSILSQGAIIYEDSGSIVLYSFTAPNTPTMLVTPELTAGTYNLEFDTAIIAGTGLQAQVGTLTNNGDSNTFNAIDSFDLSTSNSHSLEVTVNEGEFLAINGIMPANHNALSIDNLILTAVPTALFSEMSTVVSNYWYIASDWADIDNDGQLDLVISGAIDSDNDEFADTSKIDFYKNVDGTLSPMSQTNVIDLHLGSVKFIDIDNDGDQDLITSGQNYNNITSYHLNIYINNNGTFSLHQQLDGVIYSSIDTGDYDNDGDLDLLITGVNSTSVQTTIFENVNGIFSDINAGLPGVQNGNSVFADVDGDADLDILINGYNASGDNFAALYINNNGSYTASTLPFNTAESWIALGDYDNDGDLDLAYTGYNDDYDYVAKIYNNNGSGVFTDSGFTLEGVGNSSGNNPITWGDYDNDGDLDLVYAGSNNDYEDKTYLYTNNTTSFDLASERLIDLGSYANLTFIDLDGDNDLDFTISGGSDADGYVGRTRFFENNITVVNAAPNAPLNLMSIVNTDNSITFNWDAPSDDFTPGNGLFYILTIGTTENGSDIASYPVYGTTWTINNLDDSTNYYWSVSAVDTAFVASENTTAQTLSIEAYELITNITVYPVPSTSKNVTVVLPQMLQANNEIRVEIYSTLGQSVYSNTINHTISLNLSNLNSGTYLMTITSDSLQTTKKIILL